MGPHKTISLLKMQVHNYTIGPTNWDHNEVSVINTKCSLRGDAITRIVYRRTDGQTDNGVSHKLDWSRPVELIKTTVNSGLTMSICLSSYCQWFPKCIMIHVSVNVIR